MNEVKRATLAQVRQFLAGTADVGFKAQCDDARRYGWISRVLRRFGYWAVVQLANLPAHLVEQANGPLAAWETTDAGAAMAGLDLQMTIHSASLQRG